MKRSILVMVAAAALSVGVGATRAFAQNEIPPQQFTISFPFIVHGITLPAGSYRVEMPELGMVVFQSEDGSKTADSTVMTRLATSGNSPEDVSRLVFDKVGDKMYASEFWFDGQDGYLIYAAKEAHTHHVVKAMKK
jgi:hypothetical protein